MGFEQKKHVWKRAGFSKFFLHWSETISFQHEWNGGLYCGVIYSHCCPGFVQWCFIWRWHNIEMAWALNLTSTVSQLPWLKNFFNSRCRPGPCACQSNALSLNVELLNRSLLQMTPHFIPHAPVGTFRPCLSFVGWRKCAVYSFSLRPPVCIPCQHAIFSSSTHLWSMLSRW